LDFESEHHIVDVNFLKQITPENKSEKKVKLTLSNGNGITYEYLCIFDGLIYEKENTATFWFKVIQIREKTRGVEWTTAVWPPIVAFSYCGHISNPRYVPGIESKHDYLARLRLPEEWSMKRLDRPSRFRLHNIELYREEGEDDSEATDAIDATDATDSKDSKEGGQENPSVSKPNGGKRRKTKSKSKSTTKSIRISKTKSKTFKSFFKEKKRK
jgi:hypothetical protein